jgi:hypothetical protein
MVEEGGKRQREGDQLTSIVETRKRENMLIPTVEKRAGSLSRKEAVVSTP